MLPIFPLSAVLFPGGTLTLRVFEARYADMLQRCLIERQPFGACLTQERDGYVSHETIGCHAEITDFNAKDPTLLHVRVLGKTRFQIVKQHVFVDGVTQADVKVVPHDAVMPIDADNMACVHLLANILDEQAQKFQHHENEEKSPSSTRALDMTNASWVANRLCEVLPISLLAKQRLMEMRNGTERLTIVRTYLQQHHIL